MKNLFNNISFDEKKRILEQHSGGISLEIKNFQKLLKNKLGNVQPLIEGAKLSQINPSEVKEQQQNQKLTNKVATEGLKNIIPQMISSPPFDGYYSGYVISGTFGGVDYSWDFNGVEGMSGIRGSIDGQIETESNDYLMRNSRITDADPNGNWVGFGGSGTHFACYKTTGGSVKCSKM